MIFPLKLKQCFAFQTSVTGGSVSISEGKSEGMSERTSVSLPGTSVGTSEALSATGEMEGNPSTETGLPAGALGAISTGEDAGASLPVATGLCVEVGAIGAVSTGAATGASVRGTTGLVGEEGAAGVGEGTSMGILISLWSDLQMPLKSSSRKLSSCESATATCLALIVRRFLCAPLAMPACS